MPTRKLPPRPHIEALKRQARDLLAGVAAGRAQVQWPRTAHQLPAADAAQRHPGLAPAAHWHGYEAAVRILLDHGARTDLRDTLWSGTAADWARHAGRPDVAELPDGDGLS